MSKTWSLVWFLISILVVVATALPIPHPGLQGQYNPATGLYWCTSRLSCIHEIGHKLDHRAGWISHSAAYRDAIRLYMLVPLGRDPDGTIDLNSKPYRVFTAFFDTTHPDYDRLQELYANMFEDAGGQEANMPEVFRAFYDWDKARVLLAEDQKFLEK